MDQTWRDIAKPIISRVIAENAGQDEKEIKKAISAVYPFGERAMWPYKVWLKEWTKLISHITRYVTTTMETIRSHEQRQAKV